VSENQLEKANGDHMAHVINKLARPVLIALFIFVCRQCVLQ
jgi:hypothetical protein